MKIRVHILILRPQKKGTKSTQLNSAQTTPKKQPKNSAKSNTIAGRLKRRKGQVSSTEDDSASVISKGSEYQSNTSGKVQK